MKEKKTDTITNSEGKKEVKTQKAVIVLLATVVVILLGTITTGIVYVATHGGISGVFGDKYKDYTNVNNIESKDDGKYLDEMVYDENADGYKTINATADKPLASIPIQYNYTMSFPTGTSEGEVNLGNPERSTSNLMYELTLEDGTTILKTGLLKIGTTIESKTLDVDLEAGTYNAVLNATAYSDSGKYLGMVSVTVTVVVNA